MSSGLGGVALGSSEIRTKLDGTKVQKIVNSWTTETLKEVYAVYRLKQSKLYSQ